jgi:hypothetical protein
MKTKLLLTAALIGAVSLSAHAGVRVGFFVGLPAPRVVVQVPAPVVVAPVVEAVPACPAVGYVWVPGYWSGYGPARVWVTGVWRAPVHAVYVHPYGGHYDHYYGGHR